MSEEGVIKSFVVIDLETNGLPSEQFNQCAVTEISMYAFSAKHFTDKVEDTKQILKGVDLEEGVVGFDFLPPELPRVLHKLTLMVNPGRFIAPSAEEVTGLSNEMLENESTFNKNTAECINLFLERLEKPICLVAHNGWKFDYPIIRYVYEKINKSLPSSIFCVDSYNAFRELDEKQDKIEKAKNIITMLETDEKEHMTYEQHESNNKIKELENDITSETLEQLVYEEFTKETTDLKNTITSDPLEQNSQIDWQRDNETTPSRKKKTEKRKSNHDDETPAKKHLSLSVRRSLFTDDFMPKTKYPPKGVYKLGNIYRRIFKQEPLILHRAECDVEILTKLILHYGLDFLAYAEERKQEFTKVPRLGSSY